MRLEPGRLIGAFEVIGPLAAGGMGEVYRARDTRLPREVAIKVVSPELAGDASAADRLIREARLASSLNHPNIVTVLDVGDLDGRPYIVMELVDGESMHDRLVTGALPMKTAVDLFCQIADGLAAAHRAGVMHRDLKPRNIMLTSDGRAKLVDFGLGRTAPKVSGPDEPTRVDRNLTEAYAVVGTVGYMAPEQCRRGIVDLRADQFSFGAVMYEMLTGRRAFRRETEVQTMSAIIEADPEPIADLCPSVPAQLVTIVERCLAKEPAGRYASTEDLARDLHDVKSGLSVHRGSDSRHPLPTPVPAPRPYRWLGAAAVAVVLVGAFAATLWRPQPDLVAEGRTKLVRHDRRADVDAALALLERAVREDATNPLALVTLAEALVRQADPRFTPDTKERDTLLARAGELCARAQNLDTNDAAAHTVLAMINVASSQYAGAVDQAEQAIAQAPDHARAWQELGHARIRQRDFAKGEDPLKKATALAPGDWWGHHLLGSLYLNVGRDQEALAAIQSAYALAPDNSRVLNNLGTAYLRLEQYDKAKGSLEQSLVVEPSYTAYSNLGTILYYEQQYEDAVVKFEEAVKRPEAKSPQHYTLWRNLASACHQLSRFAGREHEAHLQAATLAEALLKTRPDDIVKASLADAYAALGRMREARELVTELSQRPPTDKDSLFLLATLHEQHFKDRAKALEWLERARAAGYSLNRIEGSPLLRDLRSDSRYADRIR